MSASSHRSLVVLGGGPGGYVAAIRASQLGLTTVLVEAGRLGGVCLNEGCVPSKAMIHEAAEVHGDRELGFLDTAGAAERFAAAAADRVRIVGQLRDGVRGLLRSNGVEVMSGRGELLGPQRIRVTGDHVDTELEFEQLILATGSEPVVPGSLEIDGSFVVTAREVLELDVLPRRVVVVGGGYIGLELAGALAQFGADVVVVEATGQLLAGVEPSLAAHLAEQLGRTGVKLHMETTVVAAAGGRVELSGPDGPRVDEADLVVVAVGRRPRTGGLGLAAAGVATDERGFVHVDRQLRTGVEHIRAIGDITPGPALAHRAMVQGRIAAESAAGHPVEFRPAAIPAVVFTSPEIATVGLRLDEAIACGLDAKEIRFPLSANARGVTLGTNGFGLLVYDAGTRLVLGAHLVGPGVGELIATATLAIEMGAVLEDLAGTVFAHPTMSEVFGELAELGLGRPIHTVAPRPAANRLRAGG